MSARRGWRDLQPEGTEEEHVVPLCTTTTTSLVQPSLSDWYSFRNASVIQKGDDGVNELLTYDNKLLVSIRCLFLRNGTILSRPVLWMEVFLTFVVYLLTLLMAEIVHLCNVDITERLASQVTFLMNICSTVTTIAIFLMGTFTVLNFDRWQNLRQIGVETIWQNASSLYMVTSTFVTRDEQVLSAIDRYSRASLTIVFLHHRGAASPELLLRPGVLSPEEVAKLGPLDDGGLLALTRLWNWLAEIFHGLSRKGVIKSDPVFRYLLDRCSSGQFTAKRIATQLMVPMPMAYFYLISIMVKCHNLMYAVIFGAVAVAQDEMIGRTSMTLSTLMWLTLTAVFNSLLIINQDLVNPFCGGSIDSNFPLTWLNRSMEKDMSNYGLLAASLPEWMQQAGITPKSRDLNLVQQ